MRIETGALQIDDDWTGLFIRGDDALTLMGILMGIQEGEIFTAHAEVLCGQLIKTINNDVRHTSKYREVQKIKTL